MTREFFVCTVIRVKSTFESGSIVFDIGKVETPRWIYIAWIHRKAICVYISRRSMEFVI